MKRLFLLTFFTFATLFSVQAQSDLPSPQLRAPVAADAISQGNWLLGASVGNLGYNFKSKTFSFELSPRVGYFISDNAVIGAQTQLGLIAYDEGQIFTYGLTPFVRYYFPEGARASGRFFGEAVVGFAGSSFEDSEEDAIVSSIFGLSAGYAHFVGRNVALEGTLGFIRSNANVDIGAATTGLSVGLGFNIYLPGRNNRVTE